MKACSRQYLAGSPIYLKVQLPAYPSSKFHQPLPFVTRDLLLVKGQSFRRGGRYRHPLRKCEPRRSFHISVFLMRKAHLRGNARLNAIRVMGFETPLEFDSTAQKLKDWLDLKPKLQKYAPELMLLVPSHPGRAGPDRPDLLNSEATGSPLPGEVTDDQSPVSIAVDNSHQGSEVASAQEGDDAISPIDWDRFCPTNFAAGNTILNLDSRSSLPMFDFDDEWNFCWV
jgi:hypothetical protein